MSRTNRNNHRNANAVRFFRYDEEEQIDRLVEPVAVDTHLEEHDVRITLDAVIRSHRGELVATARRFLGNERADAEDVVQDLCTEALEGEIAISPKPQEALSELIREVKARCRQIGRGQ